MHIDINGTRLWFDVEGLALVPDGPRVQSRPIVILLHGGPGSYDHTCFKPDFTRLSEIAQVIYLDQREHGRSARHDSASWSLQACADDLHEFCNRLGISNPIIYGHSLGGFIALLYASRYPGQPGGLILQSTAARFDLNRVVAGFRRAGGDQAAGLAERFYGGDLSAATEFRARCRPLFGPWVPGEAERSRINPNADLLAPGLAQMRRFNILDKLAHLKCPTLVSVGDRDPITQPADAREIADALPAGCVLSHVIEGAGHFPWKDAPDSYWPAVCRFISREFDRE